MNIELEILTSSSVFFYLLAMFMTIVRGATTVSITALCIDGIQYNSTQHNGTQYEYSGTQHWGTQHDGIWQKETGIL